MVFELGLVFALAAMFMWGFGDFFIQKSTRQVGDWETLFIISLIGTIFLFPFIIQDLPFIFVSQTNLVGLIGVSLFLLVGTILGFEALKEGKIAVVDPIYSLEIPIAGILAFFILGETIGFEQIGLIFILIIGIMLTSLKPHHFKKEAWLEKGVLIALIGSVIMGCASFMLGLSSRGTTPLLTTWFMSFIVCIACLFYLLRQERFFALVKDIWKHKHILIIVGIVDNFAWISYAFALSLSNIAITVALIESSVLINVLLGIYINKEKTYNYQKFGILIAIVSAVCLAVLMNGA